jgi:hypothetical protein
MVRDPSGIFRLEMAEAIAVIRKDPNGLPWRLTDWLS